ncbi:MAG: hypothetical protein JF609_07200 [Verrucomicrobia bacterium]|nr:hypothetical protein [Verrucomicrobiota bacterium]
MAAAKIKLLALGVFLGALLAGFGAEKGRTDMRGHVPPAVSRLAARGHLPSTNDLALAISLPLRDEPALDEFIRQLHDPAGTNFHKFITPPEFAERFGPADQDYRAIIAFARSNGLSVTETFTNRLVLSVAGKVKDIERAFQVNLQTYRHPSEPRDFFAPDREPSVPAGLRMLCVEGLDDFSRPRHAASHVNASQLRSLAFNGSGPNHEYAGIDFRNAYAPGTALNGAGQVVALLEYSDYFRVDITNYENVVGAVIGVTNYIPLSNVVVNGVTPSTSGDLEVALDIEMAIAMAPKLSQIIVYEKNTVSTTLLNRIASDNLARQVSSSWAVGNWSASSANAYDNILKTMISQGQSYFQSSGDSDAYTGSQPLDSGVTIPQDSPYATIVGGTTLAMTGNGASYNSETVWNYNLNGIPNEGSGGGISSFYGLPSWQTNFSTVGNGGSAVNRNIPDVSMTADNIFISYNNGDFGGSGYAMGTSAAAPLWAGFCALVNQQAVASSGSPVGFLNPAIYALAATTNYTNCFHDITAGNNIGTNTAGMFYATNGYDLATGLGSPNGVNLINALAPLARPFIINQPVGQAAAAGANVRLSVAALGASPLTYQWQFNGTNLPAGGNISNANTNVLTFSGAITNNTGNYTLILTNSYGSVTSSVAFLNIGQPPVFVTQPTNLTLLTGSTAVFSATAFGSTNLAYQWKKSGTNLVNGAGISGATTNVLTLTGITTNSAANYTLAATNFFGGVTSSIASLTVVLPPGITTSSLTNRTLECGGNISYSVTTNGTAPLFIQWSLDGSPVFGATNTSFALTNVHQPNHAVAVAITNIYAGVTSNATLTVNDTLAPVITLNGNSRLTNELGSVFTDPGASANDTCAGPVAVTTNGTVNT